MADQGITMSAESIPLIQAKLKTQTRRVINLPDDGLAFDYIAHTPSDSIYTGGWYRMVYVPLCGADRPIGDPIRCPWGKPGDRLYCKEPWGIVSRVRTGYAVFYPLDGVTRCVSVGPEIPCQKYDAMIHEGKVRSSRHMPKWAARIWLDLTDVRAEWLLDISPEDAIAEGVHPDVDSAVADYLAWWDRHHLKRGHPSADNPMVWALTFTLNEEAARA